MDYKEPKTRQEKKGSKNKNKEGKGIYNQKTIRLKENLLDTCNIIKVYQNI